MVGPPGHPSIRAVLAISLSSLDHPRDEQETPRMAIARKISHPGTRPRQRDRSTQAVSRKAFRAVRKTRVSQDIIEQVRDLVTSGRLKPGDRLPSERELSQALSVSRSSVREAVRAMESLGLIEARAGEGTFVASPSGSHGKIGRASCRERG